MVQTHLHALIIADWQLDSLQGILNCESFVTSKQENWCDVPLGPPTQWHLAVPCLDPYWQAHILSGAKFQIKPQCCFYCGSLSPCTPPVLQVPLSNLCLLLAPVHFSFLATVAPIPNKESLLRSENLRAVWHREGAVEGPVGMLSPRYHCHLHDRFSLSSVFWL